MAASLKAWCIHCRGRLEVPPGLGDARIVCPHCGRTSGAAAAVEYRRGFRRNSRLAWATVGVIVITGLVWLAYKYRPWISSGFDLLVDVMGSKKAAIWSLAGAFLVLFWIAVWTLFPFMMYVGLKDLRRRTIELEETSRLCARHLARLSAAPEHERTPPSAPAPVEPGDPEGSKSQGSPS